MTLLLAHILTLHKIPSAGVANRHVSQGWRRGKPPRPPCSRVRPNMWSRGQRLSGEPKLVSQKGSEAGRSRRR